MMKIVKYSILLVAISVFSRSKGQGQGQEIPIYFQSQYFFTPYIINPAIAGSKDFTSVALSYRQHVDRIAGAPRTYLLTVQTRIPDYRRIREKILKQGSEFTNIGLGGFLYNDVNGPLRKMGFQATYAYHIPLSRSSLSHLSFGISANAMLYSLFYGELNTLRDPLIDEGSQSVFVPDANFGIFYYGKNIFAGVSSNQLFENSIKWKDDKYEGVAISRNFFLMAGYKYYIRSTFLLEPSILLRTEDPSVSDLYRKLDLNLKMYFLTAAAGISFRVNEGLVAMGQYQYQNWLFGLSYEYPFSKVWNYNHGMVEVMIGLNLGKGKNRFGDSRYW